MAADVVALGAALAATRIATRADTTGRRTFGSYRAEVFASGLTVLLMLGAAAYVGIEAVGRIGVPGLGAHRPRCSWSAGSACWSTWWRWGCCAAVPARASTCAAPTSRWSPTPSARSA